MSLSLFIIILAICVLCEGFFSGSEMAVVNADRLKLKAQARKASKAALSAVALIEQPSIFFSTTLLGTNICTVTGSVVTTLYIIQHYGSEYTPFALLFWPVTLIIGELVPKSLYHYYADRIVLIVAPILLGISKLFYPLIWILSKLTDALLVELRRRFGVEPHVSREELELMIEVGDEEKSDVKEVERTLISRIFDLAEKKVENIKTPLVDVVALPAMAMREEAARLMEESEHSKIPIFSGRITNIIGVLINADLLLSDVKKSIRDLMHPAYYVPEEMPLDELFVSMKRKGESLAVVVDEYGGATGIVTNEDLMEEVVGEIRDEHDQIPTLYQRLGSKRYLISGRMEIEVANERLKLGIPAGEYETVAGYVVHLAERIPREGDMISEGDLHFTIRRASDRAVLEVEVRVKE